MNKLQQLLTEFFDEFTEVSDDSNYSNTQERLQAQLDVLRQYADEIDDIYKPIIEMAGRNKNATN